MVKYLGYTDLVYGRYLQNYTLYHKNMYCFIPKPYLILDVTEKPQAIISHFITSGKLSLLNYQQETVFYSVIKIEVPQISLYILTICIFMIVV